MANLNELSLTEAADGIRSGRFSSEELLRDCLSCIERHDRDILAWTWLDPALGLEKARHADRARSRGEPVGRLHGIPVAVKDIFLSAGIPTGMGSPIFDGNVPSRSAAIVERLEQAGAYILGKTVTSEFASQHPGKTRNPWNPRYSPGGSSSGSAAAVAARFVPAATGSQTRGSTIRPAAYCGVAGYMPSFGLMPRTGMHQLSATLDHVGLFARDVTDLALLASCCAGYDAGDPASLPAGAIGGSISLPPAQPLRFAAARTGAWHLADDLQKQFFESNLRDLERAGARVDDIDLPPLMERSAELIVTVHRCEVAYGYRELYAHSAEKMSESFRTMIREGQAIAAVKYLAALDAQRQMMVELRKLFECHDAILTPPATGEPPQTLKFMGDPSFNSYWTLCRAPAVTIPTGSSPNRLPLGLQIVGPHLGDDRLLAIARWCEQHLPKLSRSPHDA